MRRQLQTRFPAEPLCRLSSCSEFKGSTPINEERKLCQYLTSCQKTGARSRQSCAEMFSDTNERSGAKAERSGNRSLLSGLFCLHWFISFCLRLLNILYLKKKKNNPTMKQAFLAVCDITKGSHFSVCLDQNISFGRRRKPQLEHTICTVLRWEMKIITHPAPPVPPAAAVLIG